MQSMAELNKLLQYLEVFLPVPKAWKKTTLPVDH